MKTGLALLIAGVLLAMFLEPLLAVGEAQSGPAEGPRATIAPSIVRLDPGAQCRFSIQSTAVPAASTTSDSAGAVGWSVNDVPSGGTEFGTITSDGLYTAPARIPSFNEVCITATLRGAADRYAWATVVVGSARPSYVFVGQWGTRGVGRGEFRQPHGICVERDGNLLVTDSTNDRVYRFTPAGRLIGELSAGPGRFQGPRDVTVDSEGNIYVVDGTWGRIRRFSQRGELTAEWGEKGSGAGQFMRPHAFALGLEGRIYVTDVDNGRIQVYDPSGKFLFGWGERGTGPGQFTAPHGLRADPNGDIFVSEYDGRRCQKFAPDGRHLLTFAVLPPGGRLTYHAMACDRHGNTYFVVRDHSGEESAIAKYNNQGDFITRFALPPEAGRVFMPDCAAIDEAGRVYVTDKGRGSVGVDVFAPGKTQ